MVALLNLVTSSCTGMQLSLCLAIGYTSWARRGDIVPYMWNVIEWRRFGVGLFSIARDSSRNSKMTSNQDVISALCCLRSPPSLLILFQNQNSPRACSDSPLGETKLAHQHWHLECIYLGPLSSFCIAQYMALPSLTPLSRDTWVEMAASRGPVRALPCFRCGCQRRDEIATHSPPNHPSIMREQTTQNTGGFFLSRGKRTL